MDIIFEMNPMTDSLDGEVCLQRMTDSVCCLIGILTREDLKELSRVSALPGSEAFVSPDELAEIFIEPGWVREHLEELPVSPKQLQQDYSRCSGTEEDLARIADEIDEYVDEISNLTDMVRLNAWWYTRQKTGLEIVVESIEPQTFA